MVVEYIRYSVGADRAAELIAAYEQAESCLARSGNSLGYDVAQCGEDPGEVIVRMEWDSSEGHLQGFRNSAEFGEFFALVKPFVGAITEMRHYQIAAGPGLQSLASTD